MSGTCTVVLEWNFIAHIVGCDGKCCVADLVKVCSLNTFTFPQEINYRLWLLVLRKFGTFPNV